MSCCSSSVPTDALVETFVGMFIVGVVLFQVLAGKIVDLDAAASTTNDSGRKPLAYLSKLKLIYLLVVWLC